MTQWQGRSMKRRFEPGKEHYLVGIPEPPCLARESSTGSPVGERRVDCLYLLPCQGRTRRDDGLRSCKARSETHHSSRSPGRRGSRSKFTYLANPIKGATKTIDPERKHLNTDFVAPL